MQKLLKIRMILHNIFKDASFRSSVYGKCWYPLYNKGTPLTSEEPLVYNSEGQRLETFFYRDLTSAHSPYTDSKYFMYDRFNFGLKTHVYTHNAMLQQMGNPDYKYGVLGESEAIVPEDYKIFKKHKGLEKDFDLIFTHSYEILNTVQNARFFPCCSRVWYGNERYGGIWDSEAYQKKKKNISILSSNLHMCELHDFRFNLAMKCKKEGLADTFGTFDGGSPVKMGKTLQDYRYTIAIENDIKPYWFTERITSAFAAMTIPVYCGASKIDNFFNTDGIIIIKPSDFDNIDKVLAQCTEKEYEQRLPAILDNYERVKQYKNPADTWYEKYLMNRSK